MVGFDIDCPIDKRMVNLIYYNRIENMEQPFNIKNKETGEASKVYQILNNGDLLLSRPLENGNDIIDFLEVDSWEAIK